MSHLLDLGTRKFWRRAGRPVDLAGEHAWLRAPTSTVARVADDWLAAEATLVGGTLEADVADGGLLPDLTALDGPGFVAADVAPEIRDFYEHTARWRMEVWTEWSPVFWPGGELVSRQPFAEPDGSLRLESSGEPFGGHGAYVVVENDGETFAARAPVHETFRLYVDSEGVLRTNHDLRMWNATAVRLHYKLERRQLKA